MQKPREPSLWRTEDGHWTAEFAAIFWSGVIALVLFCVLLVSAATASAEPFTVCASGHAGVAEGHTTCAFAESVRISFLETNGADFDAYSPPMNQWYHMQCGGGYTVSVRGGIPAIRCAGGEGAVVYLF
jgi:hypothetical protein